MRVNIQTIDRDIIRGPGHNYVWTTINSLKNSDWKDSGGGATLCVGSFDSEYLNGSGLEVLPWDEDSDKDAKSGETSDLRRLLNCLNYVRSMRHGEGDVVVLEDDVLMCPDWLGALRKAIEEIKSDRYIITLYSPISLADPTLDRGPNHRSYPAEHFYGTQAMYYPKSVKNEVADFIHERRRSGYAPDLIVKQWALANKCLYALQGSVVEHVGDFSSVRADFTSCIHSAWNLLCDAAEATEAAHGANKVLYVFFAHREILEAARARASATMDQIGLDDFVVVCGSAETKYEEATKTLFVECNDNYEGMPGKVVKAMAFLADSEKFNIYGHFVKLGANAVVKKPIVGDVIKGLDYGGVINEGEGNRRWHLGLCDPSSPFNFKPYEGVYVPWCDGNIGYVLSRRSIDAIKHLPVPPDQIYEDLCVAIMLREKGIRPSWFECRSHFRESPLKIRKIETIASDKVGIVMPIFNRSEYLKECLDSLSKTKICGNVLVMVDDGSSDPRVRGLVEGFQMEGLEIHKLYKKKNVGMWNSFIIGFDLIAEKHPEINVYATLDSDTIHKPEWLEKTLQLYKSMYECVVTGFNTPVHRTIISNSEYCEKASAGGINLMFSRKTNFRTLRGILGQNKNGWDGEFCIACKNKGIRILCTKPSVIQHIGRHGLNSQGHRWDRAEDF